MEQKSTHRIQKVAKELGIGASSLLEFFEKSGFKDLNPNSKLDDNQYELALKKFGHEKIIKDKIIEQKELEAKTKKTTVSLDEINGSIEYSDENPEEISDEINQNVEVDTVEQLTYKISEQVVETEQNKIEKEKTQNADGLKILGKIDLNNLNKIPKKKIEEEVVVIEEHENEVIEQETDEETDEEKEIIENTDDVLNHKEIVEYLNEEIADNDEEIDDIDIDEDDEDIEDDEYLDEIEDENSEEEVTTDFVVEEEVDDGTFKIRGPKVVGKIDLNTMNLRTRPDRKSKKEKEEERKKRKQERVEQEKHKLEKLKQDKHKQDKLKNEATALADKNKRHKRKRIEKVEISKEGNLNVKERTKFKLKKETVIIDDKDVQKQVKETLQKLEQKTKSKASKFRREKRKEHHNRMNEEFEREQAQSQILKVTEFITVKEIADLMSVHPNEVIEVCFDLGQPVTINYRLDSELINMISDEFGFKVEYVQSSFEEEIEHILNDENNHIEFRPPIVTVMGHVDHGKTSLLDYIRKTNVVSGESGGITQHIGAYSVNLNDDKKITFIDTPGHEAFTAMRARGTKVTDIAIIVVAADDNIMPQTEEAIDHARAAGVPMIFAINKIDKSGADPEKIKQQLAERNILVESWGGKYGSVEISAKKGTGIDELLERIALEAEMLELKADPNRNAIATVLEARLDKGRGYITNVIVRTGTLKIGDIIVAGACYGKVKALFNEFNKQTKAVGPSSAIQILGLNGAPEPGEPLVVMDNDKEARDKADQRLQILREMEFRAKKKHSLESISRRLAEGERIDLNIIVKADVKGSVDAITDQLNKLSNEEINVNVVRSAVGQISDTDIMLAAASQAILIGFNVRPSNSARKLAESKDVEIRLYSIIYDIINDVDSAVKGMLKPTFKEEILGSAEVLEIFKILKSTIAGCLVHDGKVTFENKVRIIRDGIVVYTGKMKALKRFKDDAKEVVAGTECGISIENFNDIKVGDFIESFKEVEVQRE